MWRKIPISLIVLIAVTCPAFAQRVPGGGGETDPNKAAFLARLVGRSVAVRVYPKPSDPNGTYALVNVPLANGVVGGSGIKAAYPSISSSSIVAVWGPDQADPVVADSLGRSVWAGLFGSGPWLQLYDLAVERKAFDPWCTVVDARGEPIPRASVAVGVYLDYQRPEVLLGEDRTDDLGRLGRWVPHGTLSVLLKIHHPNYGTAAVEYSRSRDGNEGVYWASLVPLDSEAAASGVQGTVRDQYGNPVEGAIVRCTQLSQPEVGEEYFHGYTNQVATDKEGWFALCAVRLTGELQWKGLPKRWSIYHLGIYPPRGSNLGEVFPYPWISMYAGSRYTYVLAPSDLPRSSHTFSFEYAEGPVPGREQVEKVNLVFLRNGFEWTRFSGPRGYTLPSGVLRAVVERWPGEEFWFQEIPIDANSPNHLVFKSMPAIRYRGRVVDEATGEPMPDVLVAVGRLSERSEGPSLIDELSRQFEAQSAGEPTDQGPPLRYKTHDRVTRSDADGLFEFTFMPGVAKNLDEFTAVAPGRARASVNASSLLPDANGVVELPPIEMPPTAGTGGFAGFVFEDENGPVTDPDRLGDILVEVETPDGKSRAGRFADLGKVPEVIAGVYRAEAIWNDKYYVFEPVDLSGGRPSTVTFRPASITEADVTCTGRVVHARTDEPIPGALVVYNRMPGGGDLSSLTAEQWAAIDALESASDVTDPALAPLLRLLIPSTASVTDAIPQVVRTDAEGRFSLRWRKEPFTRRADCLLAFAKDFMGAQQQLTYLASPDGDPANGTTLHRLEPDANGVVAIRPMKLFPAGTVSFHPVAPNPSNDPETQRLTLTWGLSILSTISPSWVKDMAMPPRDNGGAGVYRPHSIRANMMQSIQVPADMSIALWLDMQCASAVLPIRKDIGCKQGQVVDAGRLEFQPGIDVFIHVVGSAGKGIGAIPVNYEDAYWHAAQCVTDANGFAQATLAPHQSGVFTIRYGGERAWSTLYFFFAIGGQEDAGTTFVLKTPDIVVSSLEASRE
jgi:hypothetical protein